MSYVDLGARADDKAMQEATERLADHFYSLGRLSAFTEVAAWWYETPWLSDLEESMPDELRIAVDIVKAERHEPEG